MPRPVPIARTVASLRRAVARYRDAGETVALVPTMGALHEGHLSLIRYARRRADRVVASIFVNPAQFAPSEDFSTYPRTFDADVRALAEAQTDLIWAPATVEEMYPPGFSTEIVPAGPATVGLEDAFRPHFFKGVATIVAKLLLQCLPDVAVFGEKDFQQLRVVQKMAADLNIPTTIVGAATVREPDGLAMSSRNVYLTARERAAAPTLYRALCAAAQNARDGRPLAEAVAEARETLASAGLAIDYFEARHAATLEPIASTRDGPVRLLAAAKLGNTRLIDNVGLPHALSVLRECGERQRREAQPRAARSHTNATRIDVVDTKAPLFHLMSKDRFSPSESLGTAVAERSSSPDTKGSINLRIETHTRQLIDDAAAIVGKTRTEFMIENARRQAIDVLLDQRLFVLDAGRYDAFMYALGNPPAPGPKLRSLLRRIPAWRK